MLTRKPVGFHEALKDIQFLRSMVVDNFEMTSAQSQPKSAWLELTNDTNAFLLDRLSRSLTGWSTFGFSDKPFQVEVNVDASPGDVSSR